DDLLVPAFRRLPKTIQALVQLPDLIVLIESFWRLYVDVIVQVAVQESSSNIYLMDLHRFRGGKGQEAPDSGLSDDRGEDVVKIHAKLLHVALDYNSCLESFD